MAAAHRNNLNKWHNDTDHSMPPIFLSVECGVKLPQPTTARDVSSDTADEIPDSNSRASFVTVDYEEIS
jgi:hypothetical protein